MIIWTYYLCIVEWYGNNGTNKLIVMSAQTQNKNYYLVIVSYSMSRCITIFGVSMLIFLHIQISYIPVFIFWFKFFIHFLNFYFFMIGILSTFLFRFTLNSVLVICCIIAVLTFVVCFCRLTSSERNCKILRFLYYWWVLLHIFLWYSNPVPCYVEIVTRKN